MRASNCSFSGNKILETIHSIHYSPLCSVPSDSLRKTEVLPWVALSPRQSDPIHRETEIILCFHAELASDPSGQGLTRQHSQVNQSRVSKRGGQRKGKFSVSLSFFLHPSPALLSRITEIVDWWPVRELQYQNYPCQIQIRGFRHLCVLFGPPSGCLVMVFTSTGLSWSPAARFPVSMPNGPRQRESRLAGFYLQPVNASR